MLFLLGFLVGIYALVERYVYGVGFRPILNLIMLLVLAGLILFGFGFVGEMVAGALEETRALRREVEQLREDRSSDRVKSCCVNATPHAARTRTKRLRASKFNGTMIVPLLRSRERGTSCLTPHPARYAVAHACGGHVGRVVQQRAQRTRRRPTAVTIAPADTSIPQGATVQVRTAITDSAGNAIGGSDPRSPRVIPAS